MTKFGIAKFALALAISAGYAGYADAADTGNSSRDHMMGHEGEKMGPSHMLQKMDADKDGTVSETEFVDAAKRHFKEMDKNNDGQLTSEEIQAGMKAHCKDMMDDKETGGTDVP
jgi:Ca2+-binding EF-hand superfamily protein